MDATSEENEIFEREENKRLIYEAHLFEALNIVDGLGSYVNKRKPNKVFVEAFKREHNTLQQGIFRMFLEMVEMMASDEFHTDGRNEASKNISKQLLEGFALVKEKEFLEQGVSQSRAKEYVLGEGGKPSLYLPHI